MRNNLSLAKAFVMKTDCDVGLHYFNGEKPTLKEMQKIVGGNIELVHLSMSEIMVVNEEGLLREFEMNESAMQYHRKYLMSDISIFGTVFVIDSNLID